MLMTTPETALKRAGDAIEADGGWLSAAQKKRRIKQNFDAERQARAALEAVGYREIVNALIEIVDAHDERTRMSKRQYAAILYATNLLKWARGAGPKPAEPDFIKYGDQSNVE